MDVIVWREREYYLLECKWEKEPIEEAYASQRVILLFGEEGIKRLVYGKESFTGLLNIKYRQLATKRKAEPT
jgi:hypothetical protein